LTLDCEKCFYIRKARCPEYPHVCALEKDLKEGDLETREWILKNLADKIEMRKRFKRGFEF